MISISKIRREFFFSKVSKNLSPYFRFTYQLILIFSFSVIIGCEKEEDPADLLDEPKPVPADSRTVNVIIDGPYDFKNALAHSLIDSISLIDAKEILYAPSGIQSPIILTDKFTGEVLALVHLDSIQTEVKINAESVTRAFLQLIPAFNSLPYETKGRFLNDAKGIKVYNDVLVSIDGFLKTKESIYSSKPEFIAQAILLNEYIFENFLNIQDAPGGRQAQNLESFSKWMTPDKGASIINQVRSYVYIEFVPIGQGDKITSVLEPRNFYLTPTPVPVSDLKVPDNCYTVNLSQSNNQAKSKNVFEIAKRSTEMIFGALFGSFGNSRNDCIAKIAGSLVLGVNGTILETVNSKNREIDIIKGSIKAVGDVIYTNASDLSCAKYLTSKSVWYKFIAKNAIFISRIIDGVGLLKDGTEMVPYVIAVLDGEEMSEVMQLYDGKLIQACVGGTNASTFKEIYDAGSKIYPIVKLVPKSEYGLWNKAGFEIEWKATSPNGTVNLPSSSSNSNGEATVEWTLPTNFSGEVQLIAEIKDKEKDHLFGSPVSFKIKIAESQNSITDPRDGNVYKTVKIGTQTWFAENLRYSGNIPQVASQQAWAAIWNNGNPTGQSAWAYYNNDPGNNPVYGKLYNWYAVNSGTLCPQGWHIPNQAEWTLLSNFLGGKEVSGGKMKAVTGWEEPNVGATNESGFMAFPGGDRWYDGEFIHFGSNGSWWSSTTNNVTGQAWLLELDNDVSDGILSQTYKSTGNSCRCLKD